MNSLMKRLLLPALMAGLMIFVACDNAGDGTAAPESDDAQSGSVQFSIDAVGDTAAVNTQAAIADGATVYELLQKLAGDNQINFESEGSGDLIMISSLQGFANKGADGKNWMYSVDGKLANLGVGSMTLAGGESIRWCYVVYENRTECGEESSDTQEL